MGRQQRAGREFCGVELSPAIDRFLAGPGLAESTRRAYASDLADFAAWLDPDVKHAANVLAGLTPYPAEQMEYWPVSTRVNSPAEDDPELLAPISQPL